MSSTMSETSIQQRLAALEDSVAEIRQQLPSSSKFGWLEHVIGSQKDESAFSEVIALGRALRMADHPGEDLP